MVKWQVRNRPPTPHAILMPSKPDDRRGMPHSSTKSGRARDEIMAQSPQGGAELSDFKGGCSTIRRKPRRRIVHEDRSECQEPLREQGHLQHTAVECILGEVEKAVSAEAKKESLSNVCD